jgi:hypothetical protein
MGHVDHVFQKTAFTRALYKQSLEWAVAAESAPIRTLRGTLREDGFLVRRLSGGLAFDIPASVGRGPSLITPDGRSLRLIR